MKHRITAISFVLLIASTGLSAQDVPAAPLPTLLTTASKVFVSNAGDQDNADCLRAYNEFYAGVVATNHLQPVPNPADADLILELHYTIQVGATHVTSSAGGGGGGSPEARQFRLSVIDPKTQTILWTVVETENSAIFKSNRDKNLDAAMAALIDDLKKLTGPSATPPQDKQKHAIK
jgi:hypothetical protein